VTPNINAETVTTPSVSTSPIARVTGDAVENTLPDSEGNTGPGGATVINNVTNNNVSQSGEAIMVNATGPRNQRDPVGRVI
jgi:hypothetical protein